MKKFLVSASAIVVSAIFLSTFQGLQSRSNGNIVGYTGSPKSTTGSELTCTNCHGGAVNSGPHSLAISVAGNPSGFQPGQAYTVTAKISNPTGTKAGFSLVCLDPAKANAGALSLTGGTGTRLLNSASTGRTYVNHSGTTLKSWTFTWTAPATNAPDSVTFYMSCLEVTTASNTYTTKFVFRKQVDSAPVLSTTAIAGLTQTTASSGGNITNDGGHAVTERGVCWSTSASPTVALTTKTSDGTGAGIFSSNITGLLPSTTYFVRAYAVNSLGTSYGVERTFTTPSCQYLGNISGTPTVTCANPQTTLNILGGGSLLWSTGAITPSITVNPSVQTQYYVIGTLANGCVDTAYVTVNVDQTAPPVPAITPPAGDNFCAGTQSMQSSSAIGNQWMNNNNPISGATGQSYFPVQSGTYTVTTTNPINGCTSISQVPIIVNVLPLPVISQQPVNQFVQVGNEAKIGVGIGGSGYSFHWQLGNNGIYSDVQDGSGISGSSTDTLRLTPPDASWNGNSYRCVLQTGPCTDTTNAVNLNILTRVSPNIGLSLLSVYPNPTRDILYFQGAENSVEYSVIGIAGNILRKGSISPSQGVSLKSLPAGCYFWKANSNGKSGAGRIIVQ